MGYLGVPLLKHPDRGFFGLLTRRLGGQSFKNFQPIYLIFSDELLHQSLKLGHVILLTQLRRRLDEPFKLVLLRAKLYLVGRGHSFMTPCSQHLACAVEFGA